MKERYEIPLKGFFRIESLDEFGNVKDSWEDHNQIMFDARTSMAEIFSGLFARNGVTALRLGTEGCWDSDFIPKTETEGFLKDRTRLFAEDGFTDVSSDAVPGNWKKGKVYHDLSQDRYFRVLADLTGTTLAQAVSDDLAVISTKPYVFSLDIGDYWTKGQAVDRGHGYEFQILQGSEEYFNVSLPNTEPTAVKFEFTISRKKGNDQRGVADGYTIPTSYFSEAGLMVNGRLFAMRTFPAKLKDPQTILRVIWKIIF